MTTPFDYAQFIIDYPEFVGYSSPTAVTATFNNLAVVIGQAVSALFCDDSEQYYFSTLTLAHILTCRMLGLPGRPASVGQGSENITFELNSSEWAQWWNKTVYGQEISQVMREYLMGGHYISNGQIPYNGDAMQGTYELGWVNY
jgi:hypothetical protein